MRPFKITKLVPTLFLGILLSVSSVYSAPAITDSGHPNLSEQSAIYDHRNSDTWTESALGAEGVSGGYLDVSVGVIINPSVNPYLLRHSDVRSITAKHLGTDFEFSLIPDICDNYLGLGMQAWSLFLRPEDWVFEGDWEFTMRYEGSDGYVHKQIVSVPAGPKVLPVKPSHIQIVKSSSITVSWSALGNPYTTGPVSYRFDYRIRAYDDNGVCPVIDFRGDWSGSNPNINVGTYDPSLNTVTFDIPPGWSGRKIRLENRFYRTIGPNIGFGRALQELTLP